MTGLWTIGHSTTEIDTFLGVLQAVGIGALADIRSYPGSRHSPQFGKVALAASLEEASIGYTHIVDLGGRRNKQHVDPTLNAAWRNASFRNYADYTLSDSFESGLAELLALADEHPTAYMCSEAVPWRCHRMIVSDVLTARGHTITHLIGEKAQLHVLGAWGPEPHVDHGRVNYPAESDQISLQLDSGALPGEADPGSK